MHETPPEPPTPRRLSSGAPAVLRAIRGYEWLFIVLIGYLSLFNTMGPLPGTRIPVYLLLTVIMIGLGAALAIWRFGTWPRIRRAVRRPAWMVLMAATALFSYGLTSTFFRRGVVLGSGKPPHPLVVPQFYQVMPLMCGLLTVWMAFLLVLVVPVANRFGLLWRLSAALVPLSLAGWGRVLLDTTASPRLWTQMGGSAVYPVVLVLGLAIAIAGIVRPYRPNLSAWLAVAHLALMLLTGARSAIVLCIALLVLLVIRLGRRHTGLGERLAKVSRGVFVLGGIAVAVATLASPVLGRLDSGSDGRGMTWRVGRAALGHSWERLTFGTGSGSVWPWFAFESGWLKLPYRSRITTPWGPSLYHPHSVYVNILVEFGIIGLILLAMVLYPLLVQWIRGGTVVPVVLSSATLACLVSFTVDTYLVKNFPVSLIWWLVLFTLLTTYPHGYPASAIDRADPDRSQSQGPGSGSDPRVPRLLPGFTSSSRRDVSRARPRPPNS